jgi:hypothetical protein
VAVLEKAAAPTGGFLFFAHGTPSAKVISNDRVVRCGVMLATSSL